MDRDLKEILDRVMSQDRTHLQKPLMPLNEQGNVSDCVIKGLTSPPLIPTTRTPEEIVGDEWLDLYTTHLDAYKKQDRDWNDYARRRLSGDERREFGRIINELHEHGFYDPHVVNGRLVCYTLVRGRKYRKGVGDGN